MAEEFFPIGGGAEVVDPVTGDAVSITAIKDDNDKYVLRVVNAAPYLHEISQYETPTHTQVSVADTSTQVVSANSLRKYLLIQNDTESKIYVAFGGAAVAEQGIAINAGESYTMSAMQGNLYKGAINAIHGGSGTLDILITEGV